MARYVSMMCGDAARWMEEAQKLLAHRRFGAAFQHQVRSIGVSNFSIRQLRELLSYAKIKPLVNEVCSFKEGGWGGIWN